ncbi:Uncharacterised protein [Vibrio cholerae]|nr:Uncharacterised protein [Vibrio cholerae]
MRSPHCMIGKVRALTNAYCPTMKESENKTVTCVTVLLCDEFRLCPSGRVAFTARNNMW